MTRSPVRGGVEAGGTKVVCAVGTGPDDVHDRTVIATTTPAETLGRVVDFFTGPASAPIDALGVASFGPLDLTPSSPRYGHITSTTKLGWGGTDLVGYLTRHLDVPVTLDTDVNGAAYGEYRWGAARGLDSCVYVTVGTGIGGGVVLRGQPLRSLQHPEMGHLHVQRHPRDGFAGTCPFHGDCLEGLASGPAIAARTGRPPGDLGPHLPVTVEVEAWYLAQLVTTVIYALSPQRIILGGGVLNLPGLLDAVRKATRERLAGALDAPEFGDRITDYLVPPVLGENAGVLGALALADLAAAPPTTRPRGP